MFQRGVRPDAVNAVVSGGETVADYPDDSPYPSRLLLGFVESRRFTWWSLGMPRRARA
jgi:hypothetical protein